MKDFTLFDNLEELDSESKYLVHKAKEALAHAHAPYSKFLVGAALMLDDGTVVTGANIENNSYPLCMCAERTAIYAAASVHPGKKVIKLAVVAHKRHHKELSAATCCGACRQVMVEIEHMQQRNMEVVMLGEDGLWIKSVSAQSLMPFHFQLDV